MHSGLSWLDCCGWKVLATLMALLITAAKFSKAILALLKEKQKSMSLAVHRKLDCNLCPCATTTVSRCSECRQVSVGGEGLETEL